MIAVETEQLARTYRGHDKRQDIVLPTSGTARILGHDVVAETKTVRRLIGIVFGGDRGLYPWISGRHNLTPASPS